MTDALRTFDKVGPKDMKRIALEIALKGQSGLQINDPAKQYTLKSLPGKFSGLQLLAIMYAAFQRVARLRIWERIFGRNMRWRKRLSKRVEFGRMTALQVTLSTLSL
ncbi:hypothetical protein [Limnohabitans sp. DM1]|uniref:hypothetical protein n=1 Tax=Limnohabitans sp. DM1 TaxID=1597955 RepID=UPI000A817E37|nr:hypothetical protein [Limnohabitans sp. DM1]